jgi:hypothetical protein
MRERKVLPALPVRLTLIVLRTVALVEVVLVVILTLVVVEALLVAVAVAGVHEDDTRRYARNIVLRLKQRRRGRLKSFVKRIRSLINI